VNNILANVHKYARAVKNREREADADVAGTADPPRWRPQAVVLDSCHDYKARAESPFAQAGSMKFATAVGAALAVSSRGTARCG